MERSKKACAPRLTEAERREIEREIRGGETKRSVAADALRLVQQHRGWVGAELAEIAAMLEMTPAELESVATFYSLLFRRPVGRHVILVCDSISCWITGAETVLQHLSGRLEIGPGETTADGRFTLLPVACLGACDQGPTMMIGEKLHGSLTPARVEEILAGYP